VRRLSRAVDLLACVVIVLVHTVVYRHDPTRPYGG
jgi:hypothetical protein